MPFLNAAATISEAHCKKRMQNQFQECEALPSGGPLNIHVANDANKAETNG